MPPPGAGAGYPSQRDLPEGEKSFVTTLLLSFFLGWFGVDRFYLGRTTSALVKLFTFGGFGYWVIIDLLITLCGGQRDACGFRLSGYAKHKKTAWIVLGAFFGSAITLNIFAAALSEPGAASSGWVMLTMTAATAIGGATWALLRRRNGLTAARVTRAGDPVPSLVRAHISKLAELRPLYLMQATSGNRVAPVVIRQVDSVVENVTELFRRLNARDDKAQRDLAAAEYEYKLGKLAAALDRGYLLDMLINPRLWDHPDRNIREVQSAIEALDAQLLTNIKQVNAHHGLVFEVALGGITGPRKAMDDWQRDFDRASGVE